MKKVTLLVVLALVLTFAMTASAFATTGKFFANSISYYEWNKPAVIPPGTGSPAGLFNIGANAANPGAHANYLANTAKCGMCHSVHRAAGNGTKLLPTSDASCAGCHVGGTAITARMITWTPLNNAWVPAFDGNGELTNGATAGGGGGPHNDSAATLIEDGLWNGTDPLPPAGFGHGELRYGCFTRRCHISNPHGVGSSKYKIFAAKLLFNESANADEGGDGTYGGQDAVWDDLGATDAAVERFVLNNQSIVSTTAAGLVLIHGVAPDTNEQHALVAGLTCGRPSNVPTGEDECHAEAAYAIVDKGIKENRNHATKITAGNAYRTDNTQEEAIGYGGNDNRDSKTGHVAGTFAAVPGAASYAAIAGCTSCHDQTDAANTVYGNFTFPHGQTPTGATNAVNNVGGTTGTGIRSRIWSGWAGYLGAQKTITNSSPAGMKAYDGQCLKCHRNAGDTGGIGKDF